MSKHPPVHSVKSYHAWLPLFICVLASLSVKAQFVGVVNEVLLHEKDLGTMGFFQDDFNGDGNMDFLADGDGKKHIAICTIVDNDIIVLHQFTIPDVNNFNALLYEDADGDNQKEIYVVLEGTGLIRFNNQLQPVVTFDIFNEFHTLGHIELVDVDLDQQNEWLVMDNVDGLVTLDAITMTIESTIPNLNSTSFLAGNVDEDPTPEVVIERSGRLYILDPVTGVFEDTIQYANLYDYQLVDFEQNGRNYIVSRELNKIDVYDAISETFVGSYAPSFSNTFDDFFPFQLDADHALELVLYTDNFSHFIWLNSFPFLPFNEYDVRNMRDIGTFLAKSQFSADPNDVLFVRANLGLVKFNLVTKDAFSTHVRDYPNALHYAPFGSTTEKYILSLPQGGNNSIISILHPGDLTTHVELDAATIFPEYGGIDQPIELMKFRGIPDAHLLLQDGEDFAFYNTQTRFYRLLEGYGNQLKHAADLDLDGTSELLIQDFEGITAYAVSPAFELTPLFTTPPGSSGYHLETAQLNQTKSQEIIAFSNQHFRIYSGEDGHLIREKNNVINQTISDVLPYTDGNGRFYMGLVGSTSLFIYGMYEDMLVDTIKFSNGSGNVAANIIQFNLGGQVRTFFALQKDALQVFGADSSLIFKNQAIKTPFNVEAALLVDDFDLDGRPNLLASTVDGYVELEMLAPGQFAKPFYMTSISPPDSATVGKMPMIELQFSEPVLAATAGDHIQLVSTQQGQIDFTVEQRGPTQLRLILEPIATTPEVVTIGIDGNLTSTLSHKLDINYDGLSQSNSEPPFTAVLFIALDPIIPQVSVSPLVPLPELAYSSTKRYIPFDVSVFSPTNNEMPVEQLTFQINNDQPIAATPSDSAYDEPQEILMVPLNSFDLDSGEHTLRYWATSAGAFGTDTFSHVFRVVHESGYYDKNPGVNQLRTSAPYNPVIGSKFELIATIPHGLKPISHVVGGQGSFTYIEYSRPGFGTEGIVRNMNLHDQAINWEHTLPMIGNFNPPHLDHGFVYVSSNYTADEPQLLHAFDVHNGAEYMRQTYYATWNNPASPITNDQYLIVPDNEHHGIYCLDRWTGQHLWFGQTNSSGSPFNTGGPAIHDGKVFEIHDANIQAFDIATGKLIWSVNVDEEDISNATSAVIDAATGTIFWPGSSRLFAFDIHTGNVKWSSNTGESRRNVIVYGDEVIHFTGNRLRFFNIVTGALTQSMAIPFGPAGQPVAANGRLFMNLYDHFTILNVNDLSETWSLPIEVTDVSVIDSFLLLTDNENNLHIYRSTDVVSTDEVIDPRVSVYPNPFTDELHILSEHGDIESIKIFDALGRLQYAGHANKADYDVFRAGMYFIRVHMQNGTTYYHTVVKM